MEQELDNIRELKDFVENHQLNDRYPIVTFKAIVSIKTAQKEIKEALMDVMINFNEFNSCGQLTLMENHLDPLLYPIVFEPKWQKMRNVENVFLHVTGIHKTNPVIGKYEVKIIPLKK